MIFLELGDIIYLDFSYEDDPTNSKRRPVIIIDDEDPENYRVVSTTNKPRHIPLKWYDEFRIPILNWRKDGFNKQSWCRARPIVTYSLRDLQKQIKDPSRDYIGKMTLLDFNYIISEMNKLDL